MMTEHVLSVNGLTISFPHKEGLQEVVSNVSFTIGKGETLAIVGESGSGKSLTALSIMSLLPKSAIVSGEILLRGNDKRYSINALTGKELANVRGSELGMVFQEPMSALNPIQKVGEQLAETILLHQRSTKKEAKRIAIDWLGKVQIPTPVTTYNKYPHQLSGGQKQRVMIAMAMCNNPTLLIADEPTTALDVTVQKEVVALMKGLQEQHDTAMIFITHDLALASDVADKIVVMYQGKVVEFGDAKRILAEPKEQYTKALLACRPSAEHKGTKLPVVADFMNESATYVGEHHTSTKTNEPILSVRNLDVWYEQKKDWKGSVTEYFKAVNGVSFDLNRGEVLGLVGESGCGKSTISRSLMGLLPVHDGAINFDGRDLATLNANEWKHVRREIQMIFQDPFASLNPRMTVGSIIMEPMKVHGIVSSKELKKEAERLLSLVQLPKSALSRYPHQFSGGQRQRIGIARALALKPKVILCDESVSALDISVQAQILNLLKELQQEFNLSYLFISHDLNVVHYISDRVMVMKDGKFVEQGEATKVLRNPEHEYTKELIAAIP